MKTKDVELLIRLLEESLCEIECDEEFSVGDYVKILDGGDSCSTLHGFNRGDIAVITDSPHGSDDEDYYVTHFIFNSLSGYVPKSGGYVVKATREEVAKAKAGFIGRTVGEYKQGDIVRVISSNLFYAKRPQGFIGEIVKYESRHSFRIGEDDGGWLSDWDVELVAPVEARFDLPKL